MTTITTLKNGVDVQKLSAFVEDVKREPWKGRLGFTVKSEWTGGFRAKHTVANYTVGDEPASHVLDHTVASDEPKGILGTDTGISPAEMICAALASCLTVGYAANAAAMGIDLEELRIETSALGDLQGFLNLNDVRPGVSEVTVKTFIKSNAPEEKLRELHDYVNSHSPVWDTLANPVMVRSELKIEKG